MSRYELTARPESGATSAAIGWDRPLQTFFVQVRRFEDGEETSFLWEGLDYQALSDAADAIRLAEPYCIIPEDLGQRLEIDRLKTLANVDGAAQVAMREFLNDRRS